MPNNRPLNDRRFSRHLHPENTVPNRASPLSSSRTCARPRTQGSRRECQTSTPLVRTSSRLTDDSSASLVQELTASSTNVFADVSEPVSLPVEIQPPEDRRPSPTEAREQLLADIQYKVDDINQDLASLKRRSADSRHRFACLPPIPELDVRLLSDGLPTNTKIHSLLSSTPAKIVHYFARHHPSNDPSPQHQSIDAWRRSPR